jgi:DNA primase
MNSKFVGFDVLKRSVSMAQVLDRYGLMEKLRQRGDRMNGPCPLHRGHNPEQFRVDLTRGCWICFGDCQAGGSVIDFVARKEGVGIRDAALLIQDWFGAGLRPLTKARGWNNAPGRPATRHPIDTQSNRPLRFELDSLDPNHPYLRERGLTPETIRTFGLGYCTHGTLRGWIAIPIHNAAGQLVAYAGRWPGMPPANGSRYRLLPGFRKSFEVFNLNRAQMEDPKEPLIVVEGFFGCMRVWQGGFRRVIATMGCRVSVRQLELLKESASKVILMFDDDEAGKKGAIAARVGLSPLEVRIVWAKSGGRQPDELTAEELQTILRP